MQVTENMSHRCDTGVMFGCKTCSVLLGIHTHASEFPDTELFSPISETILKIKYRAAIIGFHRNGNDQHDRGRYNNSKAGNNNIQKSLRCALLHGKSLISAHQKRGIKQVDPVRSQQNDIRNLRAHVTADGMRETVFQILVSDLGRKIPDDHAFIIFHHGMDLLFALTDMNLTADIVFILSGVHLVDHITGITVSVDHQQPSGSVQSGVNIPGAPDPQYRHNKLDSGHFDHRSGRHKPSVDQCDLKIRHNIGTDRCQRQ